MVRNNIKCYVLIVISITCLGICSCSRSIYKRMDQSFVFLDVGVAGNVVVDHSFLYSIDSLYINLSEETLEGFDMKLILPGGDFRILSSQSNKLTPLMKAYIVDFPVVETIIFYNFSCFRQGVIKSL